MTNSRTLLSVSALLWRGRRSVLLCAAVIACFLAAPTITLGVICIVPDAGGTAQMPPVTGPTCFQGYLSPSQVHMIINGLPPGTTILADTSHSRFGLTNNGPGGNLGGEFEQFNSFADIQLQGTGSLSTFNRFVSLQLQCETHTGPRAVGTPVQSFQTDMFLMQGQLPPGDPDFDLLKITGGTGMGMPSPGHTTLTQLADGRWAVDSFFDITYRIEFIGAPGGALSGMSGSTTATIRMRAGDPSSPVFCRCKGDSNLDGTVDIASDLPWFVNELLKDDGDLCADMDNNLVVDGRDIKAFIPALISGGGCPALDAWETPDFGQGTDSFYEFGGPSGHPPIPAGFFDPGSDPFTGQVQWTPLPIDPGALGPTDTIVRRPPIPGPPPPLPASAPVPIEMVELSLTGVQPIIVNTPGGPQQWQVSLGISDAPAPGGMMNVSSTGPNGGVFTANINVRPVFAFTNAQDLADLDAGLITPDDVRIRILDTGDPGSPINPLQLQFEGTSSSDWASQVCGQPVNDGLFFFHNDGFPFVPGIRAPFDPCDAFKPGPMKHVKPGEAHYIKPPNRNPGGGPAPRCGYNWIGSKVFCRGGKVGKCPPAPPVLCTKLCPQPIPCSPFVVRIVRIGCRNAAGTYNRGFCFQFYRLRPPPLDCAICP